MRSRWVAEFKVCHPTVTIPWRGCGIVPSSTHVGRQESARKVVQAWSEGRGAAPQLLRTCDACGEERWRPLDRRHAEVELDAHLGAGQRADLTLSDSAGRVRLVIQLEGGSRLPNRAAGESAAAPVIVLRRPRPVVADPLHWRPVRQRGLPRWRCRCAQARALPVDDAFSLRVLGCPINVRREDVAGGKAPSASVIHDCARCAFFVGIGYADAERRRVSLYCAFGKSKAAAPIPRIGPAPSPRLVRPVAANRCAQPVAPPVCGVRRATDAARPAS